MIERKAMSGHIDTLCKLYTATLLSESVNSTTNSSSSGNPGTIGCSSSNTQQSEQRAVSDEEVLAVYREHIAAQLEEGL